MHMTEHQGTQVRYGKVNVRGNVSFTLKQAAVDEEPAVVSKAQFVTGSGDGVATAMMENGCSIHNRPPRV
jgi:hypothetical protein